MWDGFFNKIENKFDRKILTKVNYNFILLYKY